MMIERDGRTDVIRQAAECLPSDFLVRKQFAVVLILNVTTDELHNNDYYVIILHSCSSEKCCHKQKDCVIL